MYQRPFFRLNCFITFERHAPCQLIKLTGSMFVCSSENNTSGSVGGEKRFQQDFLVSKCALQSHSIWSAF